MVGKQQKLPVIIALNTPDIEIKSQDNTNGQWLNLGDYINEVQRNLATDMGWLNFNDIVNYHYIPAMAKRVDANEFEQLASSSKVAAIYPDRFNELTLTESAQSIGQTKVAAYQAGGYGASVAVIDSGIEYSHPFFSERVVDGACFSRFNTCPGGTKRSFGLDASVPCVGFSSCKHGTHVAGIVGGKNRVQQGVAPASTLLSVNVFSVVGGKMGATDSDIIQAMEWVYEQREQYPVVAINMSLGGGFFSDTCDDSPVKRMVDILLEQGIATVIAAGNEGKIDGVASPACVSSAITVGSLDPSGKVSAFSNSYKALDIVAPGGNITSSVLQGRYGESSGTSMAAPQVAGALAFLKSAYPSANIKVLIEALFQSQGYTDPRNNVRTPSLYLPASMDWLQAKLGIEPSLGKHHPKPDRDKPNCSENIDGILVEDVSGECKKDGEIKW